MDYNKLKDEINKDPLGRGYATMTAQQVADSLNARNRTVQRSVPTQYLVRWATLYDGFHRLEQAIATGNPDRRKLARGALNMVSNPHVPSLDVNDPQIAGMLASIVALGIFTAAEMDALRVYGQQTVSRAEELGLPHMLPGYVDEARR